MKNAALHDTIRRSQSPAHWTWTTLTVEGSHFRFQGRLVEQGIWYVHVCLLKLGRWVRVSYGYFPGNSLTEISQTWGSIYADVRTLPNL